MVPVGCLVGGKSNELGRRDVCMYYVLVCKHATVRNCPLRTGIPRSLTSLVPLKPALPANRIDYSDSCQELPHEHALQWSRPNLKTKHTQVGGRQGRHGGGWSPNNQHFSSDCANFSSAGFLQPLTLQQQSAWHTMAASAMSWLFHLQAARAMSKGIRCWLQVSPDGTTNSYPSYMLTHQT